MCHIHSSWYISIYFTSSLSTIFSSFPTYHLFLWWYTNICIQRHHFFVMWHINCHRCIELKHHVILYYLVKHAAKHVNPLTCAKYSATDMCTVLKICLPSHSMFFDNILLYTARQITSFSCAIYTANYICTVLQVCLS